MKHTVFLLVLVTMTLFACESKPIEEQAKDFSLSMVEFYFTGDCLAYVASFSDTLIVMDGDGTLLKRELDRDQFCRTFDKAVNDKTKSFDDYIESYKVELKSYAQLDGEELMMLPNYYQPKDDDFFFNGFVPKEGVADFIWDDMFIFMVRKENGDWKLKGVSG